MRELIGSHELALLILTDTVAAPVSPKIILAMRNDIYNYAARAEWLGVGICGNRSVAPGLHDEEFAQTLTKIVGTGNETLSFRSAAKCLGEDCEKYGGSVLACEQALELIHASDWRY